MVRRKAIAFTGINILEGEITSVCDVFLCKIAPIEIAIRDVSLEIDQIIELRFKECFSNAGDAIFSPVNIFLVSCVISERFGVVSEVLLESSQSQEGVLAGAAA